MTPLDVKLKVLVSEIVSVLNSVKGKEDKIVFLSTPDFSDNPFYVFKELYRLGEYELVWLMYSYNNDTASRFKEKYDVPIYPLLSIKGLQEVTSAKYVFINDLLPLRPRREQEIIQLWHGLPAKRTGFAHPFHIRDLYTFMNRWVSKFLTTGVLPMLAYIAQFRIDIDKFIISTLPRLDGTLRPEKDAKRDLSRIGIDVESFDHVILYAPTYRYTSYVKEHTTSVDIIKQLYSEDFVQFLKDTNTLLVVKPHKIILGEIDNTEHIRVLSDKMLQEEFLTVNDVMNAFDILITDYSSIFFDYLVLDKPIVFFVPDYDVAMRKSGFLFPYDKFTPGRKCFNTKELVEELLNILDKKDDFKLERQTIKQLVFEKEPVNNTVTLLNDLGVV